MHSNFLSVLRVTLTVPKLSGVQSDNQALQNMLSLLERPLRKGKVSENRTVVRAGLEVSETLGRAKVSEPAEQTSQ